MANATNTKFKVGDRVITKFGQHGTVQEFQGEFIQVLNDGSQTPGGWYETSLRFETPTPAPVNPESQLGFMVGQRVEILNKHYLGGRYGKVTGFIPGYGSSYNFVQVTTDLGKIGGWFPSSIRLVAPVAPTAAPTAASYAGLGSPALTPNQKEVLQTQQPQPQAGVQLKYAGQNAAISKNSQVFQIAKNLALQLGKDHKLVNIDMVQGELVNLGYKAADLGNAAGAIFRGKNWKDTGDTYLSRRESNHARKVTVWAYVGDGVTVA